MSRGCLRQSGTRSFPPSYDFFYAFRSCYRSTLCQATRIFDAMVGDIVMDIALQTQSDIMRSRALCDVCHTRYVFRPICALVSTLSAVALVCTKQARLHETAHGNSLLVHVPPSAAAARAAGSSRQSTPIPSPSKPGSSNRVGTPNGKDRGDGNIMFECTICKRPVSFSS